MTGDRAVVAVTGIGVVTPIGIGRQAFWTALCAGGSGIAPITLFPVPEGSPKLAAEVRDFDAHAFVLSAHRRRMDKVSRMVVAAARLALDDARRTDESLAPERVGIVLGSVLGDISESAIHLDRVFTRGPSAASPMMFPNLVLNAPASYAAMEFGFTGVNLTVTQGETSGEQAIMLGCDLVRAGRADVVIAGGADELAAVVFNAYRDARALSSQRGGGEWASPYDRSRNGIVLGEGAAMVVLESLARARARGVDAYACIEEQAAFSVPAPVYGWPATAAAAVPALRRLMAGARIDLVCGAGNSSRRLDGCELDLFARVLGDGAARTWVTSVKGATAEWGAAGALTVATACLALRDQVVPPLCHLHEAAPAPFRFAARQALPSSLERALVCGIARGGAGAALALRRA